MNSIYKIFGIIILVLIGAISVFSSDNINSHEYLKIEITNKIEFGTQVQSNARVSFFDVTSYFLPYPIEDFQFLNSYQSTFQNYRIINDSGNLNFIFNFQKEDLEPKNEILNTFIVESVVQRPKITQKHTYPIRNIDPNFQRYLEFSGLIDIDENIRTKASQLAQGEDDVFIIATKIAKWIIEDVNYDLSTVTENPNQKSSEVFSSKAGVCKEITNLYTSMMRSLGIPTRVVSGYAYTNSPEVVNFVGSNWGGHAWAEVLIGDNWVPFDLTYNQYGFADATHIILDRHPYIRENSVSINASGSGISLVPNSLRVANEFKIIEKKERLFDIGFDIQLEGPDELGFESYGFIKAIVENKNDFYQVLFLRLGKTDQIELLDSAERMEIFMPNEKKEIYFKYKIPELDSRYVYTFPFTVYNEFFKEDFSVRSASNLPVIREFALPSEEEVEMVLSRNNLEFDCNFFISSPKNKINCSVLNPNNFEITKLDVCVESNCKELSLRINEKKDFSFETEKFRETVIFDYEREKGSLILDIEKPSFRANYSIIENTINFNYIVSNYQEGIIIKIYNNEIIKEESKNQQDRFSFELLNGTNNIVMEIYFKDKHIDSQNLTIEHEYIEVKKEKTNFFTRLWAAIISIFKS